MKLPNCKYVIIPREKLLNYLLSERHTVGKFKARFFRKIGFRENNVSLLRKNLLRLAGSKEIKESILSEYGTKYILEGIIKTPRNKTVSIRTVWIIETDETKPRFVTAYPI